jgi:FkbM family methyltransferase
MPPIEIGKPPFEIGSFSATLAMLFGKGVRYSTVIDLGCADGQFSLEHSVFGVFPDSVIVNIDANPVYEDSLKAIKETLGGHYLIAAVTDSNGEIEMTTSVHPYWSSLCPTGHRYWDAIRHLHRGNQGTMKVAATTLDAVVQRFNLIPPFLIKLDVQGAEVDALRGAIATLRYTSVVICEAGLDDFQAINEAMLDAGFDLFDLTHMKRLDGSLSWFYPVYLSRRLADLKKPPDWEKMFDERVVKAQAHRREMILQRNAALLDQLRAARNPALLNVR